MPPPRKGQLRLRRDGWYARVRSGKGETAAREWFRLGTTDRREAQRRLALLVKHDREGRSVRELAEHTPDAVLVRDYAESWRMLREQQGVVMARDEWAYISKYALPTIGALPLPAVTPEHISLVIERAIEAGLARGSVRHIRGALHRMFDHAWRTRAVEENPVARAPKTPRMREVAKARVLLTDEEIVRYLACAFVDLELRMMSAVARIEGGMRTGDVNGWDWTMLDTKNFATCVVPRSKTGHEQELEIPDLLRPALREWWDRAGRPASGPVFPVRRGDRVGERKAKRGTSYAARLRRDLLRAGVVRHECERPATAPPRRANEPCCARLRTDPLYHPTARTLPVDFHSFRRAFNTALAASGVNVQTAMRLADHADAKTHMRYVLAADAPELRRIPSGAIPEIGSDSLRQRAVIGSDSLRSGATAARLYDAQATEGAHSSGITAESTRATLESNQRPSAPEAVVVIGSDRLRQDPIAPIAPHDRLRQGATGSDWAVSGPRKALRSSADRDRYVADLLEEAVELSVGEDAADNEDRVHELLVEAAGLRGAK